ncbi:hypothetical protein MVEN_01973900 [Mycena venus]|uniref:DUF6533 domain-containing protein n=1 Tax=Mycena venus TaxID=2733690 RepID=A0A8H6XEB8_9AGAR|nr:hypothetical protein MVEN_01973900 [Mycena venus]
MRVSAASIYFFDYLMTLPSEYRIYKRQKNIWRPTAGCVLFILNRYVTLVSIIMATAFFFGTDWTKKTCVPAIAGAFRALSASIVSVIFMWRTWVIWHKRRPILYFLMLVFIPTTVFTWGFIFNEVPEVNNGVAGSCGGLAGKGRVRGEVAFCSGMYNYRANIVFDALCAGLSTYKLVLNIKNDSSHISSILLVDGLGYLFASIALQVLNLIFLLSTDPAKQNTMITFTNAITGLLSQRIITSLSERIVNVPSTNKTPGVRDRSLSRSRWMNVLQRPGLTDQTKSGIELSHVISVSVTQDQVTNPAYEEDGDADSGKYPHTMQGGVAV